MPDHRTHRHLVRFHGPHEDPGIPDVAEFLIEGLESGDAILVIVEQQRWQALEGALNPVAARLGIAADSGRLVFLDAETALARFTVDGRLDMARFDALMDPIIGQIRGLKRSVRVYGEMVGLLWKSGNAQAAIELERRWNRMLDTGWLTLFCGYPIDIFGEGFTVSGIDEVLREHTCLLPARSTGSLDQALQRAIREVLGAAANTFGGPITANFRPSWAAIPTAEATILWVRNNFADRAHEILSRARAHLLALA